MNTGKNPSIRLFALGGLFLLSLFAGCITPPPEADGSDSPAEKQSLPPLGLGIDVPGALPEPGPFLEDAHDLQTLETFLREDGRDLLKDCGNPDGNRSVERQLERQDYAAAVSALVRACSQPTRGLTESYVDVAMRDGREAEVKDELLAGALDALDEVATLLEAHPGPGNAVEAEFLNELINLHKWDVSSTQTALTRWSPYEDGSSRDRLQLLNVYSNLLGPRADSVSIGLVLKHYPWQGPPCTVPDRDELYARVQAKFDRALVLAEEHALPGEDRGIFQWHGRLVKVHLPQFEYYREHDWWVGILASEVWAEMHIAYWENLTQAPAWPTIEEAKFMAAAYRIHTRTMWTEDVFDRFLYYFDDELEQSLNDWQTHRGMVGAPAFMGYMAMRWPYADLQCPGSTAEA